MKFYVALLSLSLTLVGCASSGQLSPSDSPSTARTKILRVFGNPDGTVDYQKIIRFVGYGIEADCAFASAGPVVMDICAYGRPAVQAAEAVKSNDQETLRSSIQLIFAKLVADHPQTNLWVMWALKIFDALKPPSTTALLETLA